MTKDNDKIEAKLKWVEELGEFVYTPNPNLQVLIQIRDELVAIHGILDSVKRGCASFSVKGG